MQRDASDTTITEAKPSVRQDRFCFDVAVRDGKCLLSRYEAAQAAHIVPKARTDVSHAFYATVMHLLISGMFQIYQELLQDPYIDVCDEPRMGIYLRADLHKQYDMYDWSFYYKVRAQRLVSFVLRRCGVSETKAD